MVINNQLLKAAAVCTNIMRRYHARERTVESRDLMVAEVETLVGWLRGLNLPHEINQTAFLAPVGEYLLSRHGREAGGRLLAELMDVLESARCAATCDGDGARSSDNSGVPELDGWHRSIQRSGVCS